VEGWEPSGAREVEKGTGNEGDEGEEVKEVAHFFSARAEAERCNATG